MRRFLVLGGSSPRRQVSDLRLYEASGSDRTDGFGSIGSEPAGSGSARAPARASLAFEMSNGSDSESEVSFDLGADLETSTASCTADTEDKVELRASKSGGSSASSATENSRVDRAVEQPSGEQYTTRRIKEEKRLRAEFDRHRERTLLTMPSGKVECDICKKKPSVLRCFDCRRDGCSLCEECHGQRHDEHSAFAHVVEWKDESTGGYSRGAPDASYLFLVIFSYILFVLKHITHSGRDGWGEPQMPPQGAHARYSHALTSTPIVRCPYCPFCLFCFLYLFPFRLATAVSWCFS